MRFTDVSRLQATSLLVTKLSPPACSPRLVSRTRLLDSLNEARGAKLTLVVAPAGFGKTTLLREWADEVQDPNWPVQWVLLDDEDDGPWVWAYVLEALRKVAPSLTFPWIRLSPSPREEVTYAQLGAVINRIATITHPITLIIDDYHVITDNAVHQSLAYLVEHLPQNLHLIIAGRTMPPISIARLRSQGQLKEVLADDLSFTMQETEMFLAQSADVSLDEDEVSALHERTEGWIAGLQMAVLSLKGGRSAESLIDEFSGDSYQLFRYLTEEVLDHQDPDVRSFAVKASILSKMAPTLCDEVLGLHDSAEKLERLEQDGLFVIPLDVQRRWYRFHPLFAEYLWTRLQREYADEIPGMHDRASKWLEANGYPEQAIAHALSIADYERAASAIEAAFVDRSVLATDLPVILNWAMRLPHDVILSRPRLALVVIIARTALAQKSQLQEALVELGDVANQQDVPDEAHGGEAREADRALRMVRATIACIQSEYDRAIRLYEQLLPLATDEHYILVGMLSHHIHYAYFALGRFDQADAALREGARIAREHQLNQEYLSSMCAIARLNRYRGWLNEAAAVYNKALDFTGQHSTSLRTIALVKAGLSDVHREWGQLDVADQHIQTAKQYFSHRPTGYLEWNFAPDYFLCVVRNCLAHGELDAAREFLDEAEEALPEYYKIPFLAAQTAYLKVRYWIAAGSMARLIAWVEKMQRRCDDPDERVTTIERIALAQADLSLGRARDALDHLPLPSEGEAFPLLEFRIEMHLLRGLALQAEGQTASAKTALVSALKLAQPDRYVRIFVDQGRPLVSLLSAVADDLRQSFVREETASLVEYVHSLSVDCSHAWAGSDDVITRPARSPIVDFDELSARELEVLKLLAAGSSTQQISATLFISIHTTRTHVKRIFQKLEAHTREEAIQKALMAAII